MAELTSQKYTNPAGAYLRQREVSCLHHYQRLGSQGGEEELDVLMHQVLEGSHSELCREYLQRTTDEVQGRHPNKRPYRKRVLYEGVNKTHNNKMLATTRAE